MFTSGNPGSDIKKRQQRALARFLQLNVDTDLVLQLRCRRIHIFLCNLLNLCTQLMRHIHVMYSPQIRCVLLDRTENFFQKSTFTAFTEQNWDKTRHIS